MKRDAATALLRILRAAYPAAKVGPDTVELWLAELRKLDESIGEPAVRSLVASCRFWPSPAELYEQVEIVRRQRAQQARDEERRAEQEAFDAIELPPLREIPAVRDLRALLDGPPVDLPDASRGRCDDGCGDEGERYRLGVHRDGSPRNICGSCARKRLRARDKANAVLTAAMFGATETANGGGKE
jgi:hypothetical protein